MKAKKYLVWAILIAGIFGTPLATTASGQEYKEQTEDIKLLQAKIKDLEITIKIQEDLIKRAKKTIDKLKKELAEQIDKLKKELAEQVEENKKLKALCKEAGIKIEPEGKANIDFDNIVYRGRKRNRRWFETMYERFYDKIVYIDGKYIDKSLFKFERMSGNKTWPKGSIVKAPSGCKVLQVLGAGEALIYKKAFKSTYSGSTSGLKGAWGRMAAALASTPEMLFHLTGYEGQLVDEQSLSFEGALMCIGTFEYTDILGAQKTIQSFAVYKSFYESLTREQFAEAIGRGFELVYYQNTGTRTIRRPIR